MKIKSTSVDILPNLIKIPKEKNQDACFEIKDILIDEINQKFDWALLSGIFNFKLSDNKTFIQNMLKRMLDSCNKGVAADFMSTYVDFKNMDAYYASPEQIFSFSKSLSKRVVLRHDYMPFEFCVYNYKDDRINERNVFEGFDNECVQDHNSNR